MEAVTQEVPKPVAVLRKEAELYEMYRAHAYARRSELTAMTVRPEKENLRYRYVTRVDRDIWEFENMLDALAAQIAEQGGSKYADCDYCERNG